MEVEERILWKERELQWSESARGRELQTVGITSCECGEGEGITLSC